MGTAKAMGNLQLAGTSVLRVFGNQADRLKMLTELCFIFKLSCGINNNLNTMASPINF
jgi:hypothetical protein